MEARQPSTGYGATKYRILAKLGEGGMAEVYVGALDQTSGFRKLLVLKLLRSMLAEDADGLIMFLDEARLAARLNHRNVVQTYEVGQIGERHAIVMEFLEGASLSRLLRASSTAAEGDALGLSECLYIMCEALSGLHYAHELNDFDGSALGIVHRDFTPANLMVTLDGQVKVLDFGVAKTRVNVGRTHTGTIKGTARYMAREALVAQATDRRSDVYMAGAVLWQMVTRTRPWDDKEDLAVLAAILDKRLAPVRRLDPKLPVELEAIILRATDPEPSARFESAHALREALLGFARTHRLTCDPDRLAARVRTLAGAECEAFRRRVDEQLALAPLAPELVVGATGPRPSAPELDGSGSRIRSTGLHERAQARRRMGLRLLAAGIASVTGLALALTLHGDPEPGARTRVAAASPGASGAKPRSEAEVAAQAAPQLAARAPGPTRQRVLLRVSAQPPEAALYLDGERLDTNPVELSVERDDAAHELRAEASGFAPKVMEVRYDRDAQVALSLDAERARKRRRSRHERDEARSLARQRREKRDAVREPAAPQRPVREPRPARVIDTESPFRR